MVLVDFEKLLEQVEGGHFEADVGCDAYQGRRQTFVESKDAAILPHDLFPRAPNTGICLCPAFSLILNYDR